MAITPEQRAILLKSQNFREQTGIAPKSSETLSQDVNPNDLRAKLMGIGAPKVDAPKAPVAPVAQTAQVDEPGWQTLLNKLGGDESLFGKIGKFQGETFEDSLKNIIGLGISARNTGRDIKDLATAPRTEDGKVIQENRDQGANIPLVGRVEPLFTGEETVKEALPKIIRGGVDVYGAVEGIGDLKQVPGAIKQFSSAAQDVGGEVANLVKQQLKKRVSNKRVSASLEAITPNTNAIPRGEYAQLVREGKINPKTKFKEPAYILSDDEANLATNYKELISTGDPVKNTNNVMNNLTTKYKEVKPLIAKVNAPIDRNKLTSNMIDEMSKVADNNMIVSEDKIVEMVQDYQKFLKEGDLAELFEKRNAFTSDATYANMPTAKRQLDKAARAGIKKTLEESLPAEYKQLMSEMSDMYELADLLEYATKYEKGKNFIQLWAKANPVKAKALGWGTATVGGGYLVNTVMK